MGSSRPIRILLYKTSLDGHWRGAAVVATALRDAGMEVVYGGVLNPEAAVNIAIQEAVDVIGLSIGGGYGIVENLMQRLAEKNLTPLIVAGGTVPPPDVLLLEKMGVSKVFPPGSRLDHIVEYIKSNIQKR